MLTLGAACILTLSSATAGVYDDAKAVYVGNSRPEHNFAFSNNCFATCSDRSKMFARRDHFGFRIFFGTPEFDLRHDDGKRFFVHDLRDPRVGKGCRIVFDVEVDEDASPIFEIRDWQHGYVYYDAVNMPLETGHYELAATFDKNRPCRWTINGEAHDSLSEKFRLLTWLGFVSSPMEKDKWRLKSFRYEVED